MTQVVAFHPRHRRAVLDGSKTVTVRWGEALHPGPARLVFEGDAGPPIPAQVVSVERYPVAALTAGAARAPAGTDMIEYVAQLRRRYYPTMPEDAVLDVVLFHVAAASWGCGDGRS